MANEGVIMSNSQTVVPDNAVLLQQIENLKAELQKAHADLATSNYTHQELINLREKALNALKV